MQFWVVIPELFFYHMTASGTADRRLWVTETLIHNLWRCDDRFTGTLRYDQWSIRISSMIAPTGQWYEKKK